MQRPDRAVSRRSVSLSAPQVAAGAVLSILCACIAGVEPAGAAAPYPQSPVLGGLEWHETVNMGTDSDNWPTTWSDDNQVYTAAGDGTAFGGERGNWICRLTGMPGNLAGENLSRISTESGAEGEKGSGIVSVGGTLYLWARNADNDGNHADIGRSTDKGETWSWGPTFTLLGYPTFLNFGKDNAGARDGYVYTVSHDHPSAYTSSERFLLLRVPAGQIMNQGAYQYFTGTDGSGNPQWSYDPARRGAVFTYVEQGEGRCRRSGISYHASLGRYLWYQRYQESGGFGVYDAPEPWGPWTTVYFTEDWDEDPGECGGFCTKFTSGDTVWLVYSGGDNLRLRRATISGGSTGTPVPAAAVRAPLTAFPNPFTAATRAEFRLDTARPVRVDVRDVHGRAVVTLLDGALEAGAHSVAWNGRDARGGRVPAGVYFVRVDAGGDVQSKRVVHLR